MTVRTRIAPSPTGIAHVGTMYTALLNYAFAKTKKGKFILRIEDTDRERYVPGSEQVIFEALHWLGVEYAEGPDIPGPYGPYTQSKRLALYKKHARELVQKGKAYFCFCQPERLAAMRELQQQAGKLPMYDGTCRKLSDKQAQTRSAKEKHVVRLKVPKSGSTSWRDLIRGKVNFENKSIDDQVLLKSDGYPTYHLAVVVDDHLMRISHVIRAEEWISSTPKHILIFRAFGWMLPEFVHTPLLRNPDRSKLSKRRNPVSVMWYKEHGFLPEALVNYLCLMGWSHPEQKEKFPLAEFIKNFSLERIQTSQPIFDLEKLRWLNGLYIREMGEKKLLAALKPFLPKGAKAAVVKKIIPLIQERIHTLAEFTDYAHFFFTKPEPDAELLKSQSQHPDSETRKKISDFRKMLESLPKAEFKAKNLEREGRKLATGSWSAKKLFMTIRVAITGSPISPPLFETIEILGRHETIHRLQDAERKLQ